MTCFDSISPCDLILFSTLAAILIADGKDAEDLNILGNLIVAVGGLLLTIAAQKQNQTASQHSEVTIEEVEEQLKQLQKKILSMKSR